MTAPTRRLIGTILLILAVAALAAAGSLKSVAAETKATVEPPAGGPPRPLKLPAIRNEKLPNGLAVRLVEDHRFPLVTAYLVFPFGSAADPADLPGLCDATARLLKEGTAKMNSRRIAEELGGIGGQIEASADLDTTYVGGSALSEFAPRLLGLMADVATAPSFPDNEVALRKANMAQELAQARSEPSWLARDRFSREVYGKHPYAIISASDASIQALGRDRIAAFHKEMFRPGGAILVVAGDIDSSAVLREVRSAFGGWSGDAAARPAPTAPPARASRGIFLVNRPGSVQSDMRVGGLAIRRNDPSYFHLLVLNQILGGGASSRLFLKIREEKGYAYDAHSEMSARLAAGDWAAVTQVRTEVTKPALEDLLAQVEKVRAEAVPESEIQAAKSYLIGIFTLQIERPSYFATMLAEQSIYGLPADYLETYVARLNGVTADQVREAARAYLDPARAAIVVVGDGAKIGTDLASFGPVTAYDTLGKPEPEKASAAP